MSKPKAAVFASGTGSNFEALMNAEDLACEIVLLVCDKPQAKVLEKAERFGVPTFVFQAKDYDSKDDYEKHIIEELEKRDVEWIFLAGFMRIVGPVLLQAFDEKIINIHPSLLPAFPGKDAIGQAFRAKVEKTGVTIHYVDAGIDTGPIISQEEVPVYEDDTEESLQQRIHKVEHRLYPETINQLLNSQK